LAGENNKETKEECHREHEKKPAELSRSIQNWHNHLVIKPVR